jgi:hypothetical protein
MQHAYGDEEYIHVFTMKSEGPGTGGRQCVTEWIHLARYRDQLRALVYMVMNLRVL